MASYRSSNSANGGASSVTITKPTGLTAGDLMVGIISADSQSLTTPSGWTLLDDVESAAFTQHVAVFVKVADSSDAAATNFTFTCGGSTPIEGVLYAISGTFTGAANVYAYSLDNTGTEPVGDTFRCPVGITPTTASSLLIMYIRLVCGDSDNNSISSYALQTDDPTWTERAELQDNGGSNSMRIGTATATRTAVTATGYFQSATGAGDISVTGCIGVLMAITDNANGSSSPSVLTKTATINAPTATGGAATSPSVVAKTATINAPTASAAAPLWINTDKPSAPTITNTDKP